MRSSFNLNIQYSFYGNIYDTPYLSLNVKQNSQNLENVQNLVSKLLEDGFRLKFAERIKYSDKDIDNEQNGASRYFSDVPKQIIVDFLMTINCSLVNMNFNVNNILDFIEDENTLNVENWDIVFEGGDSKENYPIEGLERIKCVSRYICNDNPRVIQISSRRRILGLREGKFTLEKESLEKAEQTQRQVWIAEGLSEKEAERRNIPLRAYFEYLPKRKPILVIMLIVPTPPESGKEETKKLRKFRDELGTDKMVAFAIGFPGVKEREKAKSYKVNKTYYKLYMEDDNEITEDDEE